MNIDQMRLKENEVNQANKSQQQTKFHQNRFKTLWDNSYRNAFLHPCDLESRSHRLVKKIRVQQCVPTFQIWIKWVHKWMYANVKVFGHNSPWLHKSYSEVVSGCSTLMPSTPYQIPSQSVETCVRKRNQQVLLSADLMTPCQGHWKWYEAVDNNDAYQPGRHERNVCKSLR